MSLNVTSLKAAFGKAFGSGLMQKDLDTEFLVPSKTDAEFNLVPTELTQIRRAKTSVDQVLQAFQAAATPVGVVSIEPRSIDLQDLKYELELDPDEIEDSAVSFFADPDNNDRKSWGITKYVMNVLMIQKGRENFELHEAYKGVKAAIVPGSASSLGASFNGLGKKIADDIVSGAVTPVDSAPSWSTDPVDFVGELEAWVEACKATSEINRSIIENMCDKIHMSQALASRFRLGMKLKYNVNYAQVGDALSLFDTPNLSVSGLPSMSSRNRVFMTFKANRCAYIKRPKSEKDCGISEANPYKPMIYAKFWKALGYWHPEYVFVNQLV